MKELTITILLAFLLTACSNEVNEKVGGQITSQSENNTEGELLNMNNINNIKEIQNIIKGETNEDLQNKLNNNEEVAVASIKVMNELEFVIVNVDLNNDITNVEADELAKQYATSVKETYPTFEIYIIIYRDGVEITDYTAE